MKQTTEEAAKEMFKKHWQKATGKPADETTLSHMKYCIDAIEEALSQQLPLIGIEDGSLKIYTLECLTEDGLIENNGYYLNKVNAENAKEELDKAPRNIHYGIKQHIVEIETTDHLRTSNTQSEAVEKDEAGEKYREVLYKATEPEFCKCKEPKPMYESEPEFCAGCGNQIVEWFINNLQPQINTEDKWVSVKDQEPPKDKAFIAFLAGGQQDFVCWSKAELCFQDYYYHSDVTNHILFWKLSQPPLSK